VTLDPQLEQLRADRIAAGARPVADYTVAEARAEEAARLPDLVRADGELTIPGPGDPIQLRLYSGSTREPLPALVYFFGGGWVLGSLDAVAPTCRNLAALAECTVVAVGYRRAPEHRFPAAVEDCVAATRWIAEHGGELGLDASRFAVGGASAGGTLAAVVAQQVPSVAFQLLVYPVVAYRSGTRSLAEAGDPYFLDEAALEWSWSNYLPVGADPDNPRVSPLRAADFHGLPAAFVLVAGHDPLHDEGLAYAERLAASGVRVEVADYPTMVHGFFSMLGVLDAAAEAQARAARALRVHWCATCR
jgi:acetyl esterase